MKFAKQLGLRSIPSWAPYYLDYKGLKQYIKSTLGGVQLGVGNLKISDDNEDSGADQNGQGGTPPMNIVLDPSSPRALLRDGLASSSSQTEDQILEGFKALLNAELEKVNSRYEAQEKVGGVNLERLNASWQANFSPEELKQWRKELTSVILNLEYLLEFSQTNITGFKKIIKKFEKHYRNSHSTASSSASSIHQNENNNNGRGMDFYGSSVESTNDMSVYILPNLSSTAAAAGLGIQGRSTPTTIGTPTLSIPTPTMLSVPGSNGNGNNNMLDIASDRLYAQEPFIRQVPTPTSHQKHLLYNYYSGMSAVGMEFWKLVTDKTFAKSEKDERLLTEARTLWRKRTPMVPEHVSPLIMSIDPKDYPIWNDLDLDSLPSGRISRLWIVLGEDGLSSPIKVPVIVAKGVRPGPVVGLTAALHGNELNGIPLTHRLVLQEIQCQALHGIVVAIPVTNVPGYLAQQRGFSDGTDLNRLMPGKANGTTSQVYCHNLMSRIIKHFTHLIDLHTASKGRVNSLYVRANMQNATTRHMARLQNPQIIVHNTSPDGSLRGAAMQVYNIPAITVEIGDPSRFQKRFVKSAILGVTNILSHLKMVVDEHESPDYDPVVCAKSYWIFTKGGGILNVLPDVNTWVKKGELIATLHNIFGHEEHCYYAPEDGIVVGKSVDPISTTGCRILHLGVVHDRFPEGVMDDGHL